MNWEKQRIDLPERVWIAWQEISELMQLDSSAVDTRPDWLHPAEWLEAEVLTDRSRRWHWLAGRLAVRLALAGALAESRFPCPSLRGSLSASSRIQIHSSALDHRTACAGVSVEAIPADWPLREIRILSRDQSGRSTVPRVWCHSGPAAVSVSIAHDGDRAVAAAALGPVGVDVIALAGRPAESMLHWAAGEAAFKLNSGEHREGEGHRHLITSGPGQEAGGGFGGVTSAVLLLDDSLIAVCSAVCREAA